MTSISLIGEGTNPFKHFPSHQAKTLYIRIFTGQAAFFTLYYALAKAPMTVVVVITKMEIFIVFFLGYLVNGEAIVPLELLGIIICFGMTFIISQS